MPAAGLAEQIGFEPISWARSRRRACWSRWPGPGSSWPATAARAKTLPGTGYGARRN